MRCSVTTHMQGSSSALFPCMASIMARLVTHAAFIERPRVELPRSTYDQAFSMDIKVGDKIMYAVYGEVEHEYATAAMPSTTKRMMKCTRTLMIGVQIAFECMMTS